MNSPDTDASAHVSPMHSIDGDVTAAPRSQARTWGPFIVFFTTVFASMAAAATVVNDLPLMIVGL